MKKSTLKQDWETLRSELILMTCKNADDISQTLNIQIYHRTIFLYQDNLEGVHKNKRSKRFLERRFCERISFLGLLLEQITSHRDIMNRSLSLILLRRIPTLVLSSIYSYKVNTSEKHFRRDLRSKLALMTCSEDKSI